MSTPDPRSAEIAEYLARVRAALDDLPLEVRDDLLDDLPAHLADVAAESAQPLTERLGDPAQYAAELRAAAGLSPTDAPQARSSRWRATRQRLAAWMARADRRVGPVFGYTTARDLFAALQPGWWVLRGYLVALLVANVALDGHGLVPRVGGNELAGLVLVGATVLGSVWLGHRTWSKRWQRRALVIGGVAVTLVGLGYLLDADGYMTGRYQLTDAASGYAAAPEDLYPYGPDGRPLENIRLYDAYGNPYVLRGHPCPQDHLGNPYRDYHRQYQESHVFPRCPWPPRPYPSVPPLPSTSAPTPASPSPTDVPPSSTPSTSPSPTDMPPSPTPSASASPTAATPSPSA